MSATAEFFRARAAEERHNGDLATLDNVRARCRRAEQAWDEMANRLERTTAMRVRREAESAARRDGD